ncbi:MAG: conjugal transfer protein TraF [Gammaproteobacteria bacterium]|nr:conjugal transfer protein TraF [Gammaproteobacteria bacterium]
MIIKPNLTVTASVLVLFCATPVYAGPVYQPPGSNLTLGDVTHGNRVQSASSNPAAAAADQNRNAGKPTRGTVLSGAAGLEYGNVQNLFDYYDQVTAAYEPSEPGTGGGPGQLPELKTGLDLGQIWDNLDPDIQDAVNTIAREVATQVALAALIRAEGHAKAWIAADAPFLIGTEYLGGAWTFGVNWSGSSKAVGLVQPIDFDPDEARQALEDWFNTQIADRPVEFSVSNHVELAVDPVTNAVFFSIDNDSSILTKATQTTELNLGYSRQAWSGSAGSLFLGAEARLYLKQLSRLSVRFGDITDSEELFDAIRDSNFRSDEALGVDVGALWVGNNYQLGAQITNINEPTFIFPDVNLEPYRSETAIGFLQRDQKYTMDRQLKLEASLFTASRSWSAHLGYDADPATDPMGDRFQWLTVSAGFATDSWWIPGGRIGYRQNLAGTELKYLSIGITAFRIFNFDIASALDTVTIDGQKLPQGLMASIGFEISW